MHSYERWIVLNYLLNVLQHKFKNNKERPNEELHRWLTANKRRLTLPSIPARVEDEYSLTFDMKLKLFYPKWRKWLREVAALAQIIPTELSPLQTHINWLSHSCHLTAKESSILGLLVRADRDLLIRDLISKSAGYTNNDRFDYSELLPFLDSSVTRSNLEKGNLINYRLIEKCEHNYFVVSSIVSQVLSLRKPNPRNIGSLLLGKPSRPTLSWDDFTHLGTSRDLAKRIISVGRTSEVNGTNVLLYGPPGTGKSEFAKTLASVCGLNAHFVGESTIIGLEPTRHDRIAALTLANALDVSTNDILVIVDEADDVFAGMEEHSDGATKRSKIFMHRLVEKIKSPTIWIVNDVNSIPRTVIRRMNLVLKFSEPTYNVRRNIISRIARNSAFDITQDDISDLATISSPPAIIQNAIRSAKQIDGSAKEARHIIQSSLEAMGKRMEDVSAPIIFNPTLSSADCNLLEIADSICRARSKALSFCLSGPSGTGKSAYARYLADRLQMEVILKRFSDLASSYLGETEKAIAYTFEEAADRRSFLILDEGDSLLRDRRLATNSWEVTQVNEMLVSMEKHPYPFACTTNAYEMIDNATIRRFIFKIHFHYMKSNQISLAFKDTFNTEAPEFILDLEGLTPGDFSVVSRKANALGNFDRVQLGKWLKDEVSSKPDIKRRRIGF